MTTLLDSSGRLLARFVVWVIRIRVLVLVAALVLGALGLRYTVTNLGINTDTANMIASELPWRESFDNYRNQFPVRDRNLVVVVESPDAGLAQSYASELASRMRAEPELFPSVFLAGDGEFFARNGLLYLSVAELEELSDRLVSAQPLLGQIAGRPNGAGVLDVLRQAHDNADRFSNDSPTEALDIAVAEVIESYMGGNPRDLQWAELLQTRDPPAARQLILIRPMLDFERVRPARAAIERIRGFIDESDAQLNSAVSVRLTGTIALEHEELDSVVRSASLAGVLALVMVIIVLFWALRSVRLLITAVFSLLTGLVLTASFAALTVGHLNLLSVAFAVLYVGLGVDFILHITLRVKEALAEGAPIDSAIAIAMRSIGASLVICTLTTAAGFYAFVPSRLFQGISELGLISGTGMFVSFAISVTVLPALLATIYRSGHRLGTVRSGLSLTSFALRRVRVVLALTALIVIIAVASLPNVYFDSNPVNLRDPNAESVVALGELAQDSDADMLTMVALFATQEAAREQLSQLTALPEVREVRGVESLVPVEQQDKLFVLEDLSFVMGPGLSGVQYEPAEPATFSEAAIRLHDELSTAAVETEAAARLRSAVELLIELQNAPEELTESADRALFGDLSEQLDRLSTALQAESFSADDLPPELLERWIAEDGTVLIEIVPQENVRNNEAAGRFVSAVRSVFPEATGLPVVYDEAAGVIVTSFRQALTYAVIAIALILLVFVRSVRDCLIVLIPIFCAAIITAGSTVWIGIPFNFANIIALPLLIGVGVDNAIHMLHRLRDSSEVDDSAGSTSLAVFASGLTTIASFGNLAFSTHRGMATMGTLLTIGMVVMMAATLVFLPALLRSGMQR